MSPEIHPDTSHSRGVDLEVMRAIVSSKWKCPSCQTWTREPIAKRCLTCKSSVPAVVLEPATVPE